MQPKFDIRRFDRPLVPVPYFRPVTLDNSPLLASFARAHHSMGTGRS